MKIAFADAYRYVADPRRADVPIGGMLDAGYLASRRALMGERARDYGAGQPPGGGTVYLCAADRDGMMVSYIQSNYMGFGSGVVVPGTGISLQNRAAGFSLEPGHRNEAAGGKRPRHTIIPGFLTRGGAPVGPFGVMGGEMQPQGHLQVVSSMVDYGLNPQSALDAPRWRVEPGRGGAGAGGGRGGGGRVAESGASGVDCAESARFRAWPDHPAARLGGVRRGDGAAHGRRGGGVVRVWGEPSTAAGHHPAASGNRWRTGCHHLGGEAAESDNAGILRQCCARSQTSRNAGTRRSRDTAMRTANMHPSLMSVMVTGNGEASRCSAIRLDRRIPTPHCLA